MTAQDDNSIPQGQLSLMPDQFQTPFDRNRHFDKDKYEYWLARELMKTLGYSSWRKFKPVIEKAKTACDNAGFVIDYHFVHVDHMIPTGKGAQRKVEDVRLSRYACHLIAMNGDPDKEAIALAQTYFAVQTRRAELAQMDPKQLKRSENVTAYQILGRTQQWAERRVDTKESQKKLNAQLADTHITHKPDYGRVGQAQNAGLFEMTKRQIVEYLGIPANKASAWRDYLGRYALEAVDLVNDASAKKMAELKRELTTEEQVGIVNGFAQRAARIMKDAADMRGIDFVSGAPLDKDGNPIIDRQMRLADGRQ